MQKQCFECRNGEHDNYDDNIVMTTVRDPVLNKFLYRGYLCKEHRAQLAEDGYEVLLK